MYISYEDDENRMNNDYRILTEALELMGFENATDLNKQYEDKGSGLEFVLQQEVLLKGLMHFVQYTTHVDISVII